MSNPNPKKLGLLREPSGVKRIEVYVWPDKVQLNIGSSHLPSDLLAVVLWAQLEAVEVFQSHRKKVWLQYAEHLKSWAHERGYRLLIVPPDCKPAWQDKFKRRLSIE